MSVTNKPLQEITWQQENGWACTAYVDTDAPDRRIVELRIFPAVSDQPARDWDHSPANLAKVPEGGINSRVLREIVLSAPQGHPALKEMQGQRAHVLSDLAKLNPRKDGPTYYALLARAYVLTARVLDHPVEDLAQALRIPVRTLHTQIRKARSLALLSGVQGKAGGQLTREAEHILHMRNKTRHESGEH